MIPERIDRERPNTGVQDGFLRRSILLCCGEDFGELCEAIRGAGMAPSSDLHEYRCYRFCPFDDFTLVWTGIGTGCLEPLLYELLVGTIVQSVVLIGTAGALKPDILKGDAAFIGRAINCVTPFASTCSDWERPSIAARGLEMTIASTDLYYGFSDANNDTLNRLNTAFPHIRTKFDQTKNEVDLVDMETAQFYSLCRLYGSTGLRYCAIKGAANGASTPNEQTLYSREVLLRSAKLGLDYLLRM